jgi:hypothetical protein
MAKTTSVSIWEWRNQHCLVRTHISIRLETGANHINLAHHKELRKVGKILTEITLFLHLLALAGHPTTCYDLLITITRRNRGEQVIRSQIGVRFAR